MLLEKIYHKAPRIVQELMISIYNYRAYNVRYSGKYKTYFNYYSNSSPTLEELKEIQKLKFEHLLNFAIENSSFYRSLYSDHLSDISFERIKEYPIIDKELLRKNIDRIHTLDKKKGHISKTGGTTGKSLEVIFKDSDVQERFALLDSFRSSFGYKLGQKTAWFSGKNLLSPKDLNKNRFWKTDHFHNVRYYSTFHIHQKNMKFYVQDLIAFRPQFIVGFPSTIYEIAKYGMLTGTDFPENMIKAIFPTAETLTLEMRELIESYFKSNMYDQYASSEGAPFIFECKNKNLHLELRSGVFEVVDDENKPVKSGRLIVTSFTTYGTPLIRYDIGDTAILGQTSCSCGNQNPVVKQISGRISDFIYSEELGKVNLGNISNCLKGVKGVIQFQILQDHKDRIEVLLICEELFFAKEYDIVFINNLRERLGPNMVIQLRKVNHIPVEKSGKFRLIKNNIKF